MARAEQVFTQIRIVQSFTREGYETEAYGQAVNWARDEGLRRAVARASLTGAVTFAAFGAIGIGSSMPSSFNLASIRPAILFPCLIISCRHIAARETSDPHPIVHGELGQKHRSRRCLRLANCDQGVARRQTLGRPQW